MKCVCILLERLDGVLGRENGQALVLSTAGKACRSPEIERRWDLVSAENVYL